MIPNGIYPLRYVPPHPGPRPPRWRWRARRRWKRIIFERNQAKAWNFGALYGRKVTAWETRRPKPPPPGPPDPPKLPDRIWA